MTGTIVAGDSALRRAAYMGAALLAAILVVFAVVALAPTEHELFTRSAKSMEAVARTLGEGDELENHSIGSLSFERVYREDGLVYFQQGLGWLGDRAYGYVWSPQRYPSDVQSNVQPGVGPWYKYSLDTDLG